MKQRRQLAIAVDFDGTIVEERWPAVGPLRFMAKWVMQMAKRRGHKLILWTCREGELLAVATHFLKYAGFEFDTYNSNLPERIAQYRDFGGDCRKVSCDLLVDDKAGYVFWPWVALKIWLLERGGNK
jgi:hypothetical protein